MLLSIPMRGTTRLTILIGKFAFKLPIASPCIDGTLKSFTICCQANKNEAEIWRKYGSHPESPLTPVLFSLPFGLLNVMPRVMTYADLVTQEEWDRDWDEELDGYGETLYTKLFLEIDRRSRASGYYDDPKYEWEMQRTSLGRWKESNVIVDYAPHSPSKTNFR